MDLGLILIVLGIVAIMGAFFLYCFKPPGDPKPKHPLKPAVLEKPKKYGEINIYFGSQTGTASNFSRVLANEARQHGFDPNVVDLVDFKPEEFATPGLRPFVAIFCMATHGEGDPTDNAVQFSKWMASAELPEGAFSNLRYTVFGLGNHQYQFFNAMGRKTNQFLEKYGGQRIFNYGEGDDDVVIEDDFNDWKKDLWKELTSKIEPLPEGDILDSQEIQESKKPQTISTQFSVQFCSPGEKGLNLQNGVSNGLKTDTEFEFMTKQWLGGEEVSIPVIKELRQSKEFGSTLHLELDLAGTSIKYGAAQNCLIFPENSDEQVKHAAKYLGLDLDQLFKLAPVEALTAANKKPRKPKFPFPSPISVKDCLKHFIDLTGCIKKSALKTLAELTADEKVKQNLLYLASHEGKDEFEQTIELDKQTLVDVLVKFNLKPSFDEFIELSNRIAPRYYTICSSPAMHPQSLHIAVSLISEKLRNGKIWEGLVSKQLRTLFEDQLRQGKIPKCRVMTNASSFVFPQDKGVPIIMVGPGTGIAPFRAFCQEKEAKLKDKIEAAPFGKALLFFGCRKKNSDYIYKDELENWEKTKIIDEYHTAFSRETDQKVYVQHLLKGKYEDVFKLIVEQRGSVYVCGATSMGKEVKSIVHDLLKEKLGSADGDKFMKDMETRKAYVAELWGA